MSDKTIPLDYANDLMFEMEKAFWDERGKGARFRMTTVGREYYKNKVLPQLQSAEIEHILSTVRQILQDEGIVGQVSYDQDGRLIRVSIAGCVHHKIEDKMVALGVEPFTCMPANLIVLALEEKLDRPVELAEIKAEGEACQLLLVLFDERPKLG